MVATPGAQRGAADLDRLTLSWVLKRALLGIAILTIALGGLAWLTYSTIDPDPADAATIDEASAKLTTSSIAPPSR